MPLIESAAVALPQIDAAAVTAEQIQDADELIRAELDPDHANGLHPRLPNAPAPHFSELVEKEHARLAAGAPKEGGLDLSRYELPDAPEKGNGGDNNAAWTAALRQTSTSAQYLHARATNLSLLEAYGKNAWLIGNNRVEEELRSLERELDGRTRELETVQQGRRDDERAVAAEMAGLEQSWRTGVGRMLEAQAAGEGLRQEILAEQRRLATTT